MALHWLSALLRAAVVLVLVYTALLPYIGPQKGAQR